MLSCHRCNTGNAEGRRFCKSCGASLLVPCKLCSFGNSLEDLFCGGCGRKLSGQEETNPSQPANSDLGIQELLAEIETEKGSKEVAKKVFDQDDLEALFDEDSEEKPAPQKPPAKKK